MIKYPLAGFYEPPHRKSPKLWWLIIFIIAICFICGWWKRARAEEIIGYASWYSIASCKKEGTSGIMANGKRLNDENHTCAIWGQKFGAILKVTNLKTGASVQVMVCDRGPSKRLVKQGRIIDLSKIAFQKICPLKQGICKVKIEIIK